MVDLAALKKGFPIRSKVTNDMKMGRTLEKIESIGKKSQVHPSLNVIEQAGWV